MTDSHTPDVVEPEVEQETADAHSRLRLEELIEARDAELKRLEQLARLMDSSIRLPVVGYRIGLDGLIGLIPGAGDVATTGVSLLILIRAKRLGVGRWTLLRMAGNIALDLVGGTIPVIGDLFDFTFKANMRNLRLLHRAMERQRGG